MGHHPSPPRRLALGDGAAAGRLGGGVRTPVLGDGPVLRIVMQPCLPPLASRLRQANNSLPVFRTNQGWNNMLENENDNPRVRGVTRPER